MKGSDISIPPILHNDNLIFDDIERASLFNIYFSKQSEIDDSISNIPNLAHATNQISEIKLCENEVEDVLKVINPTKASGPDLIIFTKRSNQKFPWFISGLSILDFPFGLT